MYKNNHKYVRKEKGKCDFPTCKHYGDVITITDIEGRKSYCMECLSMFKDILLFTREDDIK